jgi:hypothetical protein
MGPRFGLDAVEKRKKLAMPGIEFKYIYTRNLPFSPVSKQFEDVQRFKCLIGHMKQSRSRFPQYIFMFLKFILVRGREGP